jgi:hypothetical protein
MGSPTNRLWRIWNACWTFEPSLGVFRVASQATESIPYNCPGGSTRLRKYLRCILPQAPPLLEEIDDREEHEWQLVFSHWIRIVEVPILHNEYPVTEYWLPLASFSVINLFKWWQGLGWGTPQILSEPSSVGSTRAVVSDRFTSLWGHPEHPYS